MKSFELHLVQQLLEGAFVQRYTVENHIFTEEWNMPGKRRNCVVLSALLILTLVVSGLAYPSEQDKRLVKVQQQVKISRDQAVKMAVERYGRTTETKYGLRMHLYPRLLPGGTRIVPYGDWIMGKQEFIICKSASWFFWLDDDPLAQFAHDTRYLIMDANTGKMEIREAEWWPVVNGEVVWGKTEERDSDATVVYAIRAELKLYRDWKHVFRFRKLPMLTCNSWIILVCGSTDSGNTFDEDVRFLYDVFKSLGYDDEHIFYVSPWTSDPGVDRTTTPANVQWAINQVAEKSNNRDFVFFYYSSHGGVNVLHCCPDRPGGGVVTANDMDNWLDTITAREMVIMLQGCCTGSFIGYYSNGTTVNAENELTGDGETNRIAITATDTEHSSYGGSAAWGSTFTGGYVASFSDASADVSGNGAISVQEAYNYAVDHDGAAQNGWSFPHMNPTSLNASVLHHYCTVLVRRLRR
jgi:hypothetical protein